MQRGAVEKALVDIGAPIQNKGFKYIVDAVILLDTEEWKNPKWISLYDYIGKMNGTTGRRVERAIRHEFSRARNNDKTAEHAEKYIGSSARCNSGSIKTLYFTLKRDEEEVSTPEPTPGLQHEEIRRIVRDELKRILGGIA